MTLAAEFHIFGGRDKTRSLLCWCVKIEIEHGSGHGAFNETTVESV